MSEDLNYELKEISKGFCQVQFESWDGYVAYIIKQMRPTAGYIWRGQRCDNWSLIPKLERLQNSLDDGNLFKIIENQNFVHDHLNRFKLATRGRRGVNPAQMCTENDWWALGQHYGLATPLLDWSVSPFVAAYFAFYEGSQNGQTPFRSVYCLHRKSLEAAIEKKRMNRSLQIKNDIKVRGPNLLDPIDQECLPDMQFVSPFTDENSRLVSQSGLFTRVLVDKKIEEIASEYTEDTGYTMMKFLIPDSDRAICLQSLNRTNINHLSLFPDLIGASEYCNLFADVGNY